MSPTLHGLSSTGGSGREFSPQTSSSTRVKTRVRDRLTNPVKRVRYVETGGSSGTPEWSGGKGQEGGGVKGPPTGPPQGRGSGSPGEGRVLPFVLLREMGHKCDCAKLRYDFRRNE